MSWKDTMNTREGITRRDDTLPDRLLRECRISDPEKRTVPLSKMLPGYYKLRGIRRGRDSYFQDFEEIGDC